MHSNMQRGGNLMQRRLFGQMKQDRNDVKDMLFHDIKWRRRGTDRRCEQSKVDCLEKRSCSDRRHDIMTFVSHIIFPKGWAKD